MTVSLPSRGLRGYGGGFLAGLISAGIFGYALTLQGAGFLIVDILAASPLFLVGLGAGVSTVTIAVVAAVMGLIYVKTVSLSLYYIAVFGLPTVVLTVLALRHTDTPKGKVWFPEGYLISAMTIYPCLAFIAGEALAMGYKGGLLGMTLDTMKGYTDSLVKAHPGNPATLQGFLNMLNLLAHILPALVGVSWIVVMLLSMFVSQRTLSQQKWNLRPDFNLTNIYISKWLLLGVVVAGLAGRFAPPPLDYLGANICIILIVPYFFQGLSVVHARAEISLFRLWILAAFYILLLFPVPWTMTPTFLFTILLGIADLWFNFRPRFEAKFKQLKTRRTI